MSSNAPYLDLDVRPLVAAKRPPLQAILDAVNQLAPDQALRLTVPFEPVPLYTLLGKQGFGYESRMESDGTWLVVFRR